jgi:hypothetical protein
VATLRRVISRLTLALAAPAGWLVAALPGLIGLGLLSFGAWMVYPPAGLITAGTLLLADKIATERGKGGGG